MFVRTDFKDRAIGLMGALGLLIAGISLQGAFDRAPEEKAEAAVLAQPDARMVSECSSLQDRADNVC